MLNKIVLLLSLVFLLTACPKGSEDAPASAAPKVSLISATLVDYDTTSAMLKLKGNIDLANISNFNVVTIYNSDNCSGVALGSGIYSDFIGTGIQVAVPSTSTTRLYLRTNTDDGCYNLTEYSLETSAQPPVFTRFDPGSPNRESTTPQVFGTTIVPSYQIQFFDDSGCTNQVGNGTGMQLGTLGITLTLTADRTNTIYTKAIEPFGHVSSCVSFASYRHMLTGPAAPSLNQVFPASPNKYTTTPYLWGTMPATASSVSIYTDPGCSTLTGQGTEMTFAHPIYISVTENATTTLYGKAFDGDGNPSLCAFLAAHIHDSIAPSPPTFTSTSPASPTRMTIYPRIKGTAPADASNIKFFSDLACMNEIGSGTKAEYEGLGIFIGVLANNVTSVYGMTYDAATNSSNCTFLTNFKHNTIPPDIPAFGFSDPISPNNQSTTPRIYGNASPETDVLRFYLDDQCLTQIGTGPGNVFDSVGIVVTVPGNVTTTIYATATDVEGNISDCTFLSNYAHSTNPAPSPGFLQTSPASPSRISVNPYIIGTAATTVSRVELFSNNTCTTSLGSSSRLTFVTSGIRATVPANTSTDIYAMSQDVYGNYSPCVLLTNFVHCNVAPFPPTYGNISPASPNNSSSSPLITGTVSQNPASILPAATVSIYDNFLCLNRLGTGPDTEFTGLGTLVNVPTNNTTTLYGRAIDAAGNVSSCQYLTDYIHDALIPAYPIFNTATPASPSYYEKPLITGSLGPTLDFLPPALVVFFSDSGCTASLASGTPTAFQSTGIEVPMPVNQTTSLYAAVYNQVGTSSACRYMGDYMHNNLGPFGLTTTQNLDGSVSLTWAPDLTASPSPSYVIKRSKKAGGPYTILKPNNLGNSFTDTSVTNGTTYFYTVAGTNITGTSLDSGEANITVGSGAPATAITLTATPGPAEVTLNWVGFNTDMNFTIYRSTQTGGPYSVMTSKVIGSTYRDASAVNGNTYYYVVVGVNPSGKASQSNEASATALDVPPAPTNLTLLALLKNPYCGGTYGITLNWTAPQYYTAFQINRGGTSGGETLLNQTGATTFTDCNPGGGSGGLINPIYYNVNAIWSTQMGPVSNEVGFSHQTEPTLTVKPGNGVVYVTWTAVSGAADYQILRATKSGGPYTVINSAYAGTNYPDTSVVNGTAYYYVVIGNFNAAFAIEGFPSAERSGIPGVNPSAPTNLVLTMSGFQPVLSWSAPSHYNGFNIYRAPAVGGPYTLIGNSLISNYTDTTAPVGTIFYKITANWGSFETAPTNIVTFRSGYPLTFTATASAANIVLSWASVLGASNYSLYRSTTSGSGWALLTTTATTSYTDTTAVVGQGYYYTIITNFPGPSTGQRSVEVSAMRTGTNVPSGVTVALTSSSSVDLIWAKVNSATQYRIYRATSVGGPYTQITTSNTNTRSVTGLSLGLTYYFKVTSVVSGIESAQSTAVSALTYGAPLAPAGTPGNNSIDVSWTSALGATSYSVERSTDGVTFSTIASGIPSTTYTDNGVTNGNQYFYRIIGAYPGVNLTSAMSLGITPGTLPLVPQGLTVVGNTTGTDLTFSWAGVPGATTYKLYQGTASGGPYTMVLQTSSTLFNTITGLTVDTTYYYVLSAMKGNRETGYSAEISVVTGVTPAAPLATAVNSSQIDLSWVAVGGATSYEILRSTDTVTFTSIATGVIGNTYSDNTIGILNYTYKYRPYKGAIAMAESSPSATITPSVAPLAPTNLVITAALTTAVIADWTPVPQATNYDIYRGTSSGGPYTLVGSVLAGTSTYTDNTVLAGTTYYYIVRSRNVSGLSSGNSNEGAINLVAAPTGLAAINAANKINLSWNAVGGATSYTVRRAYKSGGPYGVLASANAGLTFSDLQVRHGMTYYYVVDANFATGAVSPHSTETSITAIDQMNIQVPVEMIDRGLASDTLPITFDRSRTSLDTTQYDGVVTYNFEIVATNVGAGVTVYLVDSNDVVVGSIAVPGGTASEKRFRNTFTPNAGADNYRLALPATGTTNDLKIYSARLLINQVNATKTKLYFPLLSSSQSPSNSDLGGYVLQTAATAYFSPSEASIYRRDTSRLLSLIDYNAWELETITSASNNAYGTIILNNRTTASNITGTAGFINSLAPTSIQSPFDEGGSGFSTANNGQDFDVQVRCEFNCTTGNISIYKAGLWVTLESLAMADVYYRTSLGQGGINSTTNIASQRSLVDLSAFSNPTVSFQAVANVVGGTDLGDVTLMSVGANDSGFAGITALSSTLNFGSTTKTLQSTAPFAVANGTRILPQVNPVSGQTNLVDTGIVINTQK